MMAYLTRFQSAPNTVRRGQGAVLRRGAARSRLDYRRLDAPSNGLGGASSQHTISDPKA